MILRTSTYAIVFGAWRQRLNFCGQAGGVGQACAASVDALVMPSLAGLACFLGIVGSAVEFKAHQTKVNKVHALCPLCKLRRFVAQSPTAGVYVGGSFDQGPPERIAALRVYAVSSAHVPDGALVSAYATLCGDVLCITGEARSSCTNSACFSSKVMIFCAFALVPVRKF